MNKLRKVLLLILVGVLSIGTLSIPLSSADSVEVYLGGEALGINLKARGFVIVGKLDVVTREGTVCPTEGLDLKPGDVLKAIDGNVIRDMGDVSRILASSREIVTLTVVRGDEVVYYKVRPSIDYLTGEKRLGLSIRNEISGVGTLTYVTRDGRFGALGHQVCDEVGFAKDLVGAVTKCSIIGIQRGEIGNAGQLNGIFLKDENVIGKVDRVNEYGIYGSTDKIFKRTVKLGDRSMARVGRAHIYSTVSGDTVDRYDIEIIKVFRQNEPSSKSMIIRITDHRLLSQTGGIVQGMSGSPIVQDGHLIGAVTHVLVNDPTTGYGLYVDWMIHN